MRKIYSLLFAISLFAGLQLNAQVSVTATAGTTGPTVYTTVNAAFTAINAGTHQGAITISITGNTTEPATAVPLLKSATPSAYTSILLKPNAAGRIINANAAPTANRGIIELAGADNVTIDGSATVGGITKDLTFQFATTTTANMAAVRLSSNSVTGTDGADNNTIKNCNIIGPRASATATASSFGIAFSNGTTTITSSGAYSSINTIIQNNSIIRCYTGIYAQGASATYPNTGLQILGNTLGSATSADNIGSRGLFLSYSASSTTGSAIIDGNDIRAGDYTATGYSQSITGIELSTGNYGTVIRKNNIHDVSQPSVSGYGSYGIIISGSTNCVGITIINNFIRDITASYYSTTIGSTFENYGIFFSAGATLNIINHNTVFLNAANNNGSAVGSTSACINFSVSGVTISQMLNNIFVNNQASTGAYGIITSSTTNISSGNVNNNDYYTPTGKVGYYNTTNYVTLAAWQTATGKDGAGQNVNPPFTSATDLHIPNNTTTTLESGGISTATTGVTTDIDGQVRPNSGSSLPDIGADEFSIVLSPNDAGITGFNALACPGSQNVTVTLKNFGTVALTSATINWTVNSVAQTPYSFTGNLAAGASTTVVIGTYNFAVATNYTLSATTSLPNAVADGNTANDTYTTPAAVQTSLIGTFTVGTAGNYTNLTAATTALNNFGMCGPVLFTLLGSYSSAAETFPITVNSIPTAANTLTIRPASGVTAVITGNSAVAIIKLAGADYVTLDGSNNGTATRDLSIVNTNTGGTGTGVWLGSASTTNGATNNTVKNATITGAGAANTLSDIVSSSGTTLGSVAETANSNNTYQNNGLTASYYGIAIVGPAAGETANIITQNTVGSATVAAKLGYQGIFISNQLNVTATANTVIGVVTSSTSNTSGIATAGIITGGLIARNIIGDIKNTNSGGYGSHGILLNSSTTATGLTIANNFIYDVASYGYTGGVGVSDNGYGLVLATGGGYQIFYNSINLTTNQLTAGISAAINIISGVGSGLDIRNNIFANSQTTGTRYSIYSGAANTVFSSINYNDYYSAGTSTLGYIGSVRVDLAAIQAGFGGNLNSKAVLPGFVSATDLHIPAGANSQLESAGVVIAAVTTDIDNQNRPGPAGSVNGGATAPDIGADEFDGIPSAPPVVTLNTGATATCTATAHTVSVNVVSSTNPVTTVVLTYNNGSSGTVTMTLSGGNTSNGVWTGTIPAGTAGTAVTWSVTATNNAGLSATYNGASYTDAPNTGTTITANASPLAVCAGSSTTLSAVITGPGLAAIGTSAGSAGGASPAFAAGRSFYGTYWGNARQQWLIRASELTAAGLAAGNITALSINVTAVGSPAAVNGFTIKMGATAATAITTAYLTPTFTTVLGPANYTPVVGNNIHTFTTAFAWDGTSNVVLDVCFNDLTSGSTSASNSYTTPGFTCGINYGDDATTGTTCGTTSISNTSLASRPLFSLKGSLAVTATSYSWSNGAVVVGTTNPLVVNPSANTTYTVTASLNSCPLTASVAVTVNPLPAAPTTTGSVQCGTQVPAASAADPNGFTSPVFSWYTAATGGTALQSSTSATYSTAVGSTTTFYVSVKSSATACESPRTAVTVTVTSPDAVTAASTPASGCVGSSITLSATKAGTTNTYVYTWTCTSSNASTSGISGSVSGNPVSVTPTAAGTYVYQVTAVDASTNCTTTAAVSVIINNLPVTPTITASKTRICAGAAVTLTANSGTLTYCTPVYTTTQASGDFIGNVSFAGIVNTSGDAATDYTYYLVPAASVTGGGSYPISITAGGTSSLYSQQFGVWIDYNQNGTFDASEFVFSTTTATFSPTAATGNIVIPATAYNGTTRMRIVSRYSTAITSGQACSIPSGYGEAEDYDITITGGTANPAGPTYLWSNGATTQVITVNPAISTSYTVTASLGGCQSTSAATLITIVSPLNGLYSVGAGNIVGEAGHYATLTAAIADYNSLCLGGPVTFSLTDATYSTAETFPLIINSNANASSTNTLTIKPNTGVTSTITGSSPTTIFKLNGADYITIDGSNNGSATRSLTISNTSTSANSEIMWIASASATNGATNNTVKNTNLIGSGTTLSAINAGGGNSLSTTPADAANSNNTISNNSLTKAGNGIFINGYATSPYDAGWVISDNTVGSGTAGSKLSFRGILLANASNFTISRDSVIGIEDVLGDAFGITLSGAINGGSIFNNKITDVKSTTGSTGNQAYGILLGASTTASNVKVYNNFVSDITAYGGAGLEANNGYGIGLYSGGGYNLYYNSVSLSVNQANTAGKGACLFVSSNYPVTANTVNVVDNIFSNTQTVGTNYCVYVNNGSNAMFNAINYNDYYTTTNVGFLTSARVTLANWQAATGKDANSVNINPLFISATDLHINAGNGALDNLGTPVGGITTDIDADTRNSIPDIGADEYTATACSGTSGGTVIYAGYPICSSGSAILTASGYPTGTSVTYQWEYSNDNFVSNINALAGQTSVPAANTGTITSTTYYRLKTTCTATSTVWYSVSDTVFVNSPALTGTTPGSRCGIGTVTLQANAATGNTINWYETATSITPLAVGSPFVTPVISATTTYYAAAVSASSSVTLGLSPTTTSCGTIANSTLSDWPLRFNTSGSTTLVSTQVIANAAGSYTFALRTAGSSTNILTSTQTLVAGTNTVTLNWAIPAGGNYQITSTTGNLARIGTYTCTYPFTSPNGTVSIIGSATLSSSATANTNTYNCFFNLVFTEECISGRTAVVATVTPPPALTLSSNAISICAGSSSALVTLVSPVANYNNYVFTPSANVSGSAAAGWTFNPPATTTYTLDATQTGGSQCANVTSIVITVNPVPTAPVVSPSNITICSGATQALTAVATASAVTLLYENFESTTSGTGTTTYPTGWTGTNNSIGGTVAAARWRNRVDGYYYLDNKGFDDNYFYSSDGSKILLSNSDDQGSSGTKTSTIIQSPAFSTVNYVSATLTFDQSFQQIVTLADSGVVEISLNGTLWDTLKVYRNNTGSIAVYYDPFFDYYEYDYTLTNYSIPLPAAYLNKSGVAIRFRFESAYGYWWAIDNVKVVGLPQALINWAAIPSTGSGLPAGAGTPSTTNATINITPTVEGPITYTATVTGANTCTSSSSTIITVGANNWTGATSTAWDVATNWCSGTIPTISNSVSIPVGLTNYPVVNNGIVASVKNLTIATGGAASLTINNGGTFNATGNVANSGTVTNNGLMQLSGTSGTQTFPGPGNINSMMALELNNTGAGISLNNAVKIDSVLKPTAGILALGNNNVTIGSRPTGTASISVINPASGFTYNTGRFVIERYLNAGATASGRRWQFVSTPVRPEFTIRNTWQEAGIATPNYGTVITGPGGGIGLDATTPGPSMKYYNYAMDNYTSMTHTDTALTNPLGFMLFVRGDRTITVTPPVSGSTATTLRSTGKIYDLGITAPAVNVTGARFQSIGNPLPAAVNFTNLTFTGDASIKNSFIVWDPYINTLGGFVTISQVTGWTATPTTPRYASPNGTGANDNRVIQSGQAFFVHSFATAGAVGFTESAKNLTSRLVNRGDNPSSEHMMLRANLYAGAQLSDGNATVFDDMYSSGIDGDDADKLVNYGENFGLVRNTRSLAVEARAAINANDTIFFKMTGMKQQAYRIAFEPTNMAAAIVNAELVDNYLGTRTPVTLADTSSVSITVTSDAASSAADRFMVVFKQAAGPLPVTFISVAASRNTDRSIAVNWKVANEVNIERYTIERSADGNSFTGIITTDVGNTGAYAKNDLSPLSADNYYRIKAVSTNGRVQYSSTVKVAPLIIKGMISVNPNPVEDKKAQVVFTNMAKGTYKLQLTDKLGQVVYTGTADVTGSSFAKSIELNSTVAAGAYIMKAIAMDGTVTNIQVLVK